MWVQSRAPYCSTRRQESEIWHRQKRSAWRMNCRIAKSWIAVLLSLYLTLEVPDSSALRKVTGVARRFGKIPAQKGSSGLKSVMPLDRKAATIAAIQSQSEVAVKPRPYAAPVWGGGFFALWRGIGLKKAA